MNDHQNQQPIVFLVDDDKDVRLAIERIMKSVQLEVILYSSAREFLEQFQPKHPSCILLDQRLPEMTGLELYKRLKEKNILIPVIIRTGYADVTLTKQALQEGIFDFIQKKDSNFILIDCVQRAIQYDKKCYEEEKKREEIRKHLQTLTPREYEVMMFMAIGKDRKEIAAKLDNVSEKTIDNHRNRVLNKMKVHSLVELVHLLSFCGLIPSSKEIVLSESEKEC